MLFIFMKSTIVNIININELSYSRKLPSKVQADKKYFISILPSADGNNKAVQQLNSGIRRFCKANKIKYINLYPLFLVEDGEINTKLYYDGVHLNLKGYLKLRESIKPFISQINT